MLQRVVLDGIYHSSCPQARGFYERLVGMVKRHLRKGKDSAAKLFEIFKKDQRYLDLFRKFWKEEYLMS